MSDQYPRMVYRKGGDQDVFGLKCETSIVETAQEERDLAADGWARTPFEAHGVEAPKPDPLEDQPADDEKIGLLDEIEQLQRDISELRDQLKAAEIAGEQSAKELAEARELLAEAAKPADKPKPKETLGIKAN